MSETMDTSQIQTVNLLEFAESAFTEEVNIDIENKTSKKFSCNLCDFKNKDKGGMKRHITNKHRPGGMKRPDTDDNHEEDAKKAKMNESTPLASSTQKLQNQKLNKTISGCSNETLLNLLDDDFDFGEGENFRVEEKSVEELVALSDDETNDTADAENVDAVKLADSTLMEIKIAKLEEELRWKNLECAEKDATFKALKAEQTTMIEDMSKMKCDIKTKDDVIESNLGNINSLEESLKKQLKRVEIMNPLMNKLMNENKFLKSKMGASKDDKNDTETNKLKSEIKVKNQTIKVLNEHKSQLANEIKTLQEKANISNNKDAIEKCIKLTTDLSAKQTEGKAMEKENKKMNETLADLQVKLSDTNNKLAEAKVSITRLQEFNSQMFELCKGTKLIDNLDKEHKKDLENQSKTFENDATKKVTSKDDAKNQKVDRKCWHYENGFCKKGDFCNYLHPKEICSYYSKYGQCPQGLVCNLRHPLRICMKFMEGGCNMGDICVLQHPASTTAQQPRIVSPSPPPPLSSHRRFSFQSTPPGPTYDSLPYPMHPNQNFNTIQNQPHIPTQPMQLPAVPYLGPQTPSASSHLQNVRSFLHGSTSNTGNNNSNTQQGFW